MLTIYHNPRCSKSRQTLVLIEEAAIEVTIVEYLKEPLGTTQIKTLLSQLNVTPIEMMRVKEDEFKAQNLSNASDDVLIAAMSHCAKLIERPIVSDGKKAIIGRPPENVLTLIK
jgi:arsenate reductase